jgi:stalled ribosome alternative rescue factor ArfA
LRGWLLNAIAVKTAVTTALFRATTTTRRLLLNANAMKTAVITALFRATTTTRRQLLNDNAVMTAVKTALFRANTTTTRDARTTTLHVHKQTTTNVARAAAGTLSQTALFRA